ncbi:MAG: type II toxin-antitoxin system VapC family toxin [Deltaproteobacteria bacterium]|nr:type II toxin-antitoxin system VapC family toxin [Deltaproteobacteria bacterium]
MILVDANLLLYAEDSLSPRNGPARQWWDEALSGSSPVCLRWSVLSAFIRISTNPRVFERPLALDEATSRVQSWLDQPCTRLIDPSQRHWDVFRELLLRGKAAGNLVTDAHFAALAIEHGCTLCSTDSDFSRFPGLQWVNPLEEAEGPLRARAGKASRRPSRRRNGSPGG